jgi:membrane-associated phospholipid phosphatase
MKGALLCIIVALAPVPLAAQQPDPAPTTATPASDASTAASPSPASSTSPAAYDRPVSWRLMPWNLASDQKQIWLAPAQLGHRRNWLPVAAALVTTAALVAGDPKEAVYFRRASTYNSFNNVFSGNHTQWATLATPLTLYAAGLLRRDKKMSHTALLAGEAVADAELLTGVLKGVTARRRPIEIPDRANFYDSWFEGSKSRLRGQGSFPSGHTIAAFSVAAVIAHRYGNHRWVPYAAYGAATLIGVTRLTLSAHYGSDVFVGGVLGYSISRFAVLRD